MEDLNITIEGLNLDTVISVNHHGDPTTMSDAIVAAAVAKLAGEDEYRGALGELQRRIARIRDEEIRSTVRPIIESAMTTAILPTNQWGEPTGKPATTLTQLIVERVNEFFTKNLGDSYSRSNQTAAQKVVAELVDAALTKELAAAIVDEKAKVVAAVRAKAAELIATAVKEGVGR